MQFSPEFQKEALRLTVKVEGMVVEGLTADGNLTVIASSVHLRDSPAYFFKVDFEKKRNADEKTVRRSFSLSMDSVEVLYEKVVSWTISISFCFISNFFAD